MAMKQKTASGMRPVVEAYAGYKGNKKTFCRENGLAQHTLDYWRRKFRDEEERPSGFVALEVSGGSHGQRLELHYPNGVRAVLPLDAPAGLLRGLIQLAD